MNIEFSVTLTRKEYLSIITDHVLAVFREKMKQKNLEKILLESIFILAHTDVGKYQDDTHK